MKNKPTWYKLRKHWIMAVQWTGENYHEIINFTKCNQLVIVVKNGKAIMIISFKDYDVTLQVGDFIIRDRLRAETDHFDVYTEDGFNNSYEEASTIEKESLSA